jgi:hypothetical protein
VRLNEIYEAYRDRMDFYCVYIQEAHPSDGWQVARNLNDAVLHDQPTTIEERAELAEVCAVQLDMAMPMLLDTMSNEVDTLYAALPERLYVLDGGGVVRFRSVIGSPGFDVDAWHEAVQRAVA